MLINDIFSSYRLNERLTLKNRIVLAPFMRLVPLEDGIPDNELAQYYADRAEAGLLITEAVMVSPEARGYANNLGIYSESQINRWKEITDAVHKRNGKIFVQLWHAGRVSHPKYVNGKQPVAPSAIPLAGAVPWSEDLHYGMPKALNIQEIRKIIEDFTQAGINAKEAGFDGVELHGGNGYLIDEFLHAETNRRLDEYGESPENKTRFILEIIDSLANIFETFSIGVRLSPAAYLNMNHHEGDLDTFKYLLKKLEKRNLAYVHEAINDDFQAFEYLGGRVSEFLRKFYRGTLICNGGFTLDSARKVVETGACDLVSFGRLFSSHPDLVRRIRLNQPTL